jgi:homoserine O-acetyltransferase
MTTVVNQTAKSSKLPLKAVIDTIPVKESIALDSGKVIEPFAIRYSVYGDLALPVVVVLGGITSSRYVADFCEYDDRGLEVSTVQKGWWDELAGNNKAIDTQQYCVVSFDYLSTVTLENKAGQSTIHSLTPADQAIILKTLLQALAIEKPISIVGSSYGGMVGLSFAELYPQEIQRLVCISASDHSTHTARAIRAIQKGIFELADAPEQKHQALSLARQLAILFYRTDDIFDTQFVHPVVQQPLGKVLDYDKTIYSYLNHQGQKFANQTNISSYSALLDSIDTHTVRAEKIDCDTHFIAVPTDRLVNYESMRKLAHNVNGKSEFYRLESIYGHDAFLKEFEKLSELLKKILGEGDESSTSYAGS